MSEDSSAKRRRYSTEPDVEVEVEGEVFNVHSQPLMLASAVFQRMLEHDMQESNAGRIRLVGKLKEEFRSILPWVSVNRQGARTVTSGNFPVLLRWADEYQLGELEDACEQFLLSESPVSPEALKTAVEFNLERRVAQCTEAILQDIRAHVMCLQQVADHDGIMAKFWPAVFQAAGVRTSEPISGRPSMETLWPLIASAVHAFETTMGRREFNRLECNRKVKLIKNASVLKSLCETAGCPWTEGMACCAGRTGTMIRRESFGIKLAFDFEGHADDYYSDYYYLPAGTIVSASV